MSISKDGSVTPHGLLSSSPADFLRGHEKTYSNKTLRFGVIKNVYPVGDPGNVSKLSTEYDVEVIEQDMNRGMATSTYKKCLSVDSLGSVSDYFEKNFRSQTESDNALLPLTKGQNGATVLVLCLDATTGKGIILGGLRHPDRPTTLVDSEPRLSGEYNGVAIDIEPDGSCSLIFKGATDNNGKIIDSSQGPTEFQIKTDGSFEFKHSAITITADKSGLLTITATGDANVTCVNANVTASGETKLTSTGHTTVKADKICLNGTADDPMAGLTSSASHQQVIDLITGVPVMPSQTVFMDPV